MTFGSLFAGIGGFDLGLERAGMTCRWQVEQDKQAQAVLRHRFRDAVLYDDVRTVGVASLESVDVICGGFPCQDVSVAGKREGLGGERTGLFWEVVRIGREMQPELMVLENVPGLLSSHGGRDFHACLAALADGGFRRAYRILDSRYFGVAQRRRRVFIVLRARGCGDGAEQILFESASRGGDSQASDEAGPRVAATLRGRSHGAGVNMPGRGGEDDQNLVTGPLCGGNDGIGRRSEDDPNLVYALRGNERNTSQGPGNYVAATLQGNSGRNHIEDQYVTTGERERALTGSMSKHHDDDTDTLIVNALCPVGGGADDNDAQAGHLVATLDTSLGHHRGSLGVGDFCVPTLQASLGHHGHSSPRGDGSDPLVTVAATLDQRGRGPTDSVMMNIQQSGTGVRRLTPLECERLQGFPDGWTCLCGEGHRGSKFCTCPDSPRYRQLGNAVTVNVAEWIGHRILEASSKRTRR